MFALGNYYLTKIEHRKITISLSKDKSIELKLPWVADQAVVMVWVKYQGIGFGFNVVGLAAATQGSDDERIATFIFPRTKRTHKIERVFLQVAQERKLIVSLRAKFKNRSTSSNMGRRLGEILRKARLIRIEAPQPRDVKALSLAMEEFNTAFQDQPFMQKSLVIAPKISLEFEGLSLNYRYAYRIYLAWLEGKGVRVFFAGRKRVYQYCADAYQGEKESFRGKSVRAGLEACYNADEIGNTLGNIMRIAAQGEMERRLSQGEDVYAEIDRFNARENIVFKSTLNDGSNVSLKFQRKRHKNLYSLKVFMNEGSGLRLYLIRLNPREVLAYSPDKYYARTQKQKGRNQQVSLPSLGRFRNISAARDVQMCGSEKPASALSAVALRHQRPACTIQGVTRTAALTLVLAAVCTFMKWPFVAFYLGLSAAILFAHAVIALRNTMPDNALQKSTLFLNQEPIASYTKGEWRRTTKQAIAARNYNLFFAQVSHEVFHAFSSRDREPFVYALQALCAPIVGVVSFMAFLTHSPARAPLALTFLAVFLLPWYLFPAVQIAQECFHLFVFVACTVVWYTWVYAEIVVPCMFLLSLGMAYYNYRWSLRNRVEVNSPPQSDRSTSTLPVEPVQNVSHKKTERGAKHKNRGATLLQVMFAITLASIAGTLLWQYALAHQAVTAAGAAAYPCATVPGCILAAGISVSAGRKDERDAFNFLIKQEALRGRLAEIIANGKNPLLSVDMDDTLLPFGAIITDDVVDTLLNYAEAGGYFAINSLADKEWMYLRVLDTLCSRAYQLRKPHLLSHIPLILKGGKEVYVYEVFGTMQSDPLPCGGYRLVHKQEQSTKAKGLIWLAEYLKDTAMILALYADQFIIYENDGNALGEELIPIVVNVGDPIFVSGQGKQQVFNAIPQGPRTTLTDLQWLTRTLTLDRSLPEEREFPRKKEEKIAIWTFNKGRHMRLVKDCLVRVIVGVPRVGAPGFVWAGCADAKNNWENVFLVPLVKNRITHEALLPKGTNIFRIFWSTGEGKKSGHWEEGYFHLLYGAIPEFSVQDGLLEAGSRVQKMLAADPSRQIIIGIDGSMGSGKSYIARLIAEALRAAGISVTVLKLDPLHLQLYRDNGPDKSPEILRDWFAPAKDSSVVIIPGHNLFETQGGNRRATYPETALNGFLEKMRGVSWDIRMNVSIDEDARQKRLDEFLTSGEAELKQSFSGQTDGQEYFWAHKRLCEMVASRREEIQRLYFTYETGLDKTPEYDLVIDNSADNQQFRKSPMTGAWPIMSWLYGGVADRCGYTLGWVILPVIIESLGFIVLGDWGIARLFHLAYDFGPQHIFRVLVLIGLWYALHIPKFSLTGLKEKDKDNYYFSLGVLAVSTVLVLAAFTSIVAPGTALFRRSFPLLIAFPHLLWGMIAPYFLKEIRDYSDFGRKIILVEDPTEDNLFSQRLVVIVAITVKRFEPLQEFVRTHKRALITLLGVTAVTWIAALVLLHWYFIYLSVAHAGFIVNLHAANVSLFAAGTLAGMPMATAIAGVSVMRKKEPVSAMEVARRDARGVVPEELWMKKVRNKESAGLAATIARIIMQEYPAVWRQLRHLPDEVIHKAYVRRLNLEDERFKDIFLHWYAEQGLIRAIEELAQGCRVNCQYDKGILMVRALPGFKLLAGWPEVKCIEMNKSFEYSCAAVEWAWFTDLQCWLPVGAFFDPLKASRIITVLNEKRTKVIFTGARIKISNLHFSGERIIAFGRASSQAYISLWSRHEQVGTIAQVNQFCFRGHNDYIFAATLEGARCICTELVFQGEKESPILKVLASAEMQPRKAYVNFPFCLLQDICRQIRRFWLCNVRVVFCKRTPSQKRAGLTHDSARIMMTDNDILPDGMHSFLVPVKFKNRLAAVFFNQGMPEGYTIPSAHYFQCVKRIEVRARIEPTEGQVYKPEQVEVMGVSSVSIFPDDIARGLPVLRSAPLTKEVAVARMEITPKKSDGEHGAWAVGVCRKHIFIPKDLADSWPERLMSKGRISAEVIFRLNKKQDKLLPQEIWLVRYLSDDPSKEESRRFQILYRYTLKKARGVKSLWVAKDPRIEKKKDELLSAMRELIKVYSPVEAFARLLTTPDLPTCLQGADNLSYALAVRGFNTKWLLRNYRAWQQLTHAWSNKHREPFDLRGLYEICGRSLDSLREFLLDPLLIGAEAAPVFSFNRRLLQTLMNAVCSPLDERLEEVYSRVLSRHWQYYGNIPAEHRENPLVNAALNQLQKFTEACRPHADALLLCRAQTWLGYGKEQAHHDDRMLTLEFLGAGKLLTIDRHMPLSVSSAVPAAPPVKLTPSQQAEAEKKVLLLQKLTIALRLLMQAINSISRAYHKDPELNPLFIARDYLIKARTAQTSEDIERKINSAQFVLVGLLTFNPQLAYLMNILVKESQGNAAERLFQLLEFLNGNNNHASKVGIVGNISPEDIPLLEDARGRKMYREVEPDDEMVHHYDDVAVVFRYFTKQVIIRAPPEEFIWGYFDAENNTLEIYFSSKKLADYFYREFSRPKEKQAARSAIAYHEYQETYLGLPHKVADERTRGLFGKEIPSRVEKLLTSLPLQQYLQRHDCQTFSFETNGRGRLFYFTEVDAFSAAGDLPEEVIEYLPSGKFVLVEMETDRRIRKVYFYKGPAIAVHGHTLDYRHSAKGVYLSEIIHRAGEKTAPEGLLVISCNPLGGSASDVSFPYVYATGEMSRPKKIFASITIPNGNGGKLEMPVGEQWYECYCGKEARWLVTSGGGGLLSPVIDYALRRCPPMVREVYFEGEGVNASGDALVGSTSHAPNTLGDKNADTVNGDSDPIHHPGAERAQVNRALSLIPGYRGIVRLLPGRPGFPMPVLGRVFSGIIMISLLIPAVVGCQWVIHDTTTVFYAMCAAFLGHSSGDIFGQLIGWNRRIDLRQTLLWGIFGFAINGPLLFLLYHTMAAWPFLLKWPVAAMYSTLMGAIYACLLFLVHYALPCSVASCRRDEFTPESFWHRLREMLGVGILLDGTRQYFVQGAQGFTYADRAQIALFTGTLVAMVKSFIINRAGFSLRLLGKRIWGWTKKTLANRSLSPIPHDALLKNCFFGEYLPETERDNFRRELAAYAALHPEAVEFSKKFDKHILHAPGVIVILQEARARTYFVRRAPEKDERERDVYHMCKSFDPQAICLWGLRSQPNAYLGAQADVGANAAKKGNVPFSPFSISPATSPAMLPGSLGLGAEQNGRSIKEEFRQLIRENGGLIWAMDTKKYRGWIWQETKTIVGFECERIDLATFLRRHDEVFDPTLGKRGAWRSARDDDKKALSILYFFILKKYNGCLIREEDCNNLAALALSGDKKGAALLAYFLHLDFNFAVAGGQWERLPFEIRILLLKYKWSYGKCPAALAMATGVNKPGESNLSLSDASPNTRANPRVEIGKRPDNSGPIGQEVGKARAEGKGDIPQLTGNRLSRRGFLGLWLAALGLGQAGLGGQQRDTAENIAADVAEDEKTQQDMVSLLDSHKDACDAGLVDLAFVRIENFWDLLERQQTVIKKGLQLGKRFEFTEGLLYHGGADLDNVLLENEARGELFLTRAGHEWAISFFTKRSKSPAIFVLDTKYFNSLQKSKHAELIGIVETLHGVTYLDPYPKSSFFSLDEVEEIWVSEETFDRYKKIANAAKPSDLAPEDRPLMAVQAKLRTLLENSKIKKIPGLRHSELSCDTKEERIISYARVHGIAGKYMESRGLFQYIPFFKIEGEDNPFADIDRNALASYALAFKRQQLGNEAKSDWVKIVAYRVMPIISAVGLILFVISRLMIRKFSKSDEGKSNVQLPTKSSLVKDGGSELIKPEAERAQINRSLSPIPHDALLKNCFFGEYLPETE
ncbi:MAG: hypothetical protein NTU54_07420, partial [Candidatus Omnitrophica bacterium]|nr:hypothetical protein [Candidatus Omnitrophota bacterium]